MKVLVACEFSGTVRDAFIAKGIYAMSCDLLPSDTPGPHYQGDVFDIIGQNWDLMIAHPPCTYLANSGVSWLHKKEGRWIDLIEGAVFFRNLLMADIPMIAVENPIMHKYARSIIGHKQTQIVQPWMFGHTEQKATGLWLRNLPNLVPTDNVRADMLLLPDSERQRTHWLPPSKDRSRLRSITFQGIADAMADQWGNIDLCPYCGADEMTDHPDGESQMCDRCKRRS